MGNTNESKRIILRNYRVTIPKSIRDELGLKDGSVFQVEVEDEQIILKVIKR